MKGVVQTLVVDPPLPPSEGSIAPPFNPVNTEALSSAFVRALDRFLRSLEGKNRSTATVLAYRSDLIQFFGWLQENNGVADSPETVERIDLAEFLIWLSRRQLSGVTRARKLASLREFFRFLEVTGDIDKSPAVGIDTPKKERPSRTALRPEEYNRVLAVAGGHPRDFAIFQVFLQTGIRVSELCKLNVADVDQEGRMLHVHGKGQVERDIELEKKAIQAIKSYLAVRPESHDSTLFLNRYGEPIGERGVRKLVMKYLAESGVAKKASPHSFRHTFGTMKAEKGVSTWQLQEWLGHKNVNTTQIYVHLARTNAKKVMDATSL